MKTFKDLKFKSKGQGLGTQARLYFSNGYGVSVINGYGTYVSNDREYELAIFKSDSLCYDTYITNDVIGGLLKKDVTKIMKQVQELKND